MSLYTELYNSIYKQKCTRIKLQKQGRFCCARVYSDIGNINERSNDRTNDRDRSVERIGFGIENCQLFHIYLYYLYHVT